MSLNAVATNSFFKGLKCPYTGKPITVKVVAHGNNPPMYFSPDAYDPTMPHRSIDELLTKVSTRDGVINSKRGGKERRCAYTGHEMALTATGNLFSFLGGFSPATLHKDPYEYAKKLHTRDGKLTADPKLFEHIKVDIASREPAEEMTKPSDMPSDTAMASVEHIAASKFKRITVAVPHGMPKSKKGA
jgi:hypothetical protein